MITASEILLQQTQVLLDIERFILYGLALVAVGQGVSIVLLILATMRLGRRGRRSGDRRQGRQG